MGWPQFRGKNKVEEGRRNKWGRGEKKIMVVFSWELRCFLIRVTIRMHSFGWDHWEHLKCFVYPNQSPINTLDANAKFVALLILMRAGENKLLSIVYFILMISLKFCKFLLILMVLLVIHWFGVGQQMLFF